MGRIKLVDNDEAITIYERKGNKCGCYKCGAKDSVEAVEMIKDFAAAPYRLVSTVCSVCGHKEDKHQRYFHDQGWVFNEGNGFFDGVVPGEKKDSVQNESTRVVDDSVNAKKYVQKIGLLQKYYEMACHNLLCYSKNYAMNQPKEKYESEWKEAQAECELLQEMINELPKGYNENSCLLE
ncbi:hypothetical protein Dtox_4208 [Desulfofarcimen acetoxidans DSM 771]|uniref:Uncharacterized protein n=1 Tax=Desulfofarcimen acetoxidans (strain ATCC 49208 / DSM 771 / KCTC 5769 / VKM B-1644 / 5575) TaxID=485916 RepID=C8VZD0_DESAS|nr:hypothetical protein [Desulfofarcimen acetoxidans]ACV64875.1 hypothetical protein Dtox_4208 [Desulfofarcimen acetoxidans DSM 771]